MPPESIVDDPNTVPVETDTVVTPPANEAPVIEGPESTVIPDPALIARAIESGNPIDAPYGLKADGTPAKKRGPKSRSPAEQSAYLQSVTDAPPRRNSPPLSQTPPPVVADYRGIAQLAANLFFNVPQMIVGEEWAPEPADVPIVAKGFEDYFRAQGITALSPTLALCLVLGSYTAARVTKPTIQSRLNRGIEWVKSKLNFRKR